MCCLLLVSLFAKKIALVPLLFNSATTKKNKQTNLSVLLKREPELYYPAELLVPNPGPDFYVTKPNRTKQKLSPNENQNILFCRDLGPESGSRPVFIYNHSNYLKSGIRVPDPD